MSAILDRIQDNYAYNFPTQVPLKATQGFVVTAALNLFFGRAMKVALVGGALAATATIIEAVTRPIMRAIFPQNPGIARCIQVTVAEAGALGIGSLVAPWVGVSYKITPSFLLVLIAWIGLNDRFYSRNEGMVGIL